MRRLVAMALGVLLSLVSMVATADAQQNFTIPVENGTFELRNAKLEGGRFGMMIRGELVNHTAIIYWDELDFRIVLYDKKGQPLVSSEPMKFNGLNGTKDGSGALESYVIGADKFKVGNVGKFDITYDSGTYPAHYVFVMTKPAANESLAFEDDSIDVSFTIPSTITRSFSERLKPTTSSLISFSLKNKTDNPIKVDWNAISYVDPSGTAHKVMHDGIRFSERDSPHPASTIPPMAKLADFVYPTDAVLRSGTDWETPKLLPNFPLAASLKGKSFSIFMPLEIGGATKNYNFVFTIADVLSKK